MYNIPFLMVVIKNRVCYTSACMMHLLCFFILPPFWTINIVYTLKSVMSVPLYIKRPFRDPVQLQALHMTVYLPAKPPLAGCINTCFMRKWRSCPQVTNMINFTIEFNLGGCRNEKTYFQFLVNIC